jgi:hypothetical protein
VSHSALDCAGVLGPVSVFEVAARFEGWYESVCSGECRVDGERCSPPLDPRLGELFLESAGEVNDCGRLRAAVFSSLFGQTPA